MTPDSRRWTPEAGEFGHPKADCGRTDRQSPARTTVQHRHNLPGVATPHDATPQPLETLFRHSDGRGDPRNSCADQQSGCGETRDGCGDPRNSCADHKTVLATHATAVAIRCNG